MNVTENYRIKVRGEQELSSLLYFLEDRGFSWKKGFSLIEYKRPLEGSVIFNVDADGQISINNASDGYLDINLEEFLKRELRYDELNFEYLNMFENSLDASDENYVKLYLKQINA